MRKVLHGSRVRGLLEYLWSPGRHEEHENPRVVAAWDTSYVGMGSPADMFERGLLAAEMDAPRRIFSVDVSRGQGHVYHVPISVHAGDGELTDQQWREIAEFAAGELGFTEAPGRAAVPWVAVRHGLSSQGNDHIHLVATLVREDGRIPDMRGDYRKWSEIAATVDERYNLVHSRTRHKGAGMSGLTRGEMAKAEREGRHETPRRTLARKVRAAATGARDEADFIRRVRKDGVLIRPRWEAGGQTNAVGYSVALTPATEKERPIWYGGGKLAEDLTIDQIRSRWTAPDTEQQADARREWRPRGWRKLPTKTQVVHRRLRAEALHEAGRVTGEVRVKLAALDPHDVAGWAGVARETSGVLSALAQRAEPFHHGPLSKAADTMSRLAQTQHDAEHARRSPDARPMAGVARVVVDAAIASRGGSIAVAVLVQQLGRLVREVQRANEVAGRVVEARLAASAAEAMLEHVRQVPVEQGAENSMEHENDRTAPTTERDTARLLRDAASKTDKERGHDRD
ncbi:hypothetical protein SAMN04488074_1369 [Lentzea albidocapillata subsp. violacea]|uniref:MobA/VirD2-like nuclease domain-containing protein n=1 Tax=Lentzea albidocapillata subsp. violacea TaxID=128104 RepID=A0A1G9YX58_9PSEU|nr:hypothetical protein SAMN04488074_1369 [Lentzea albidocapillata subsp. violacea]